MIGVMIVDDQAPVRMGLALMLRHDPEVTVLLEAEDGKDALERLAHAEDIGAPLPDVVLMDVRMPGMDGIDATARYPRPRPHDLRRGRLRVRRALCGGVGVPLEGRPFTRPLPGRPRRRVG